MNALKRGVFLFLCLYCLIYSTCLYAADNESAAQLIQLLQSYKTYQAHFVQMTFQPGDSHPQVSSGWMMMQRPRKFRWQIQKPMQQIIIANGDKLLVYDVALQQVTQRKVSDGVLSPAYLLSGHVTELMKQYQVTQVKRAGKLWYQLKPIKASNFEVIQMHFSKGRLAAMWVKNNLGAVSQFVFHDIKINQPLKANLFKLVLPPGVDILG